MNRSYRSQIAGGVALLLGASILVAAPALAEPPAIPGAEKPDMARLPAPAPKKTQSATIPDPSTDGTKRPVPRTETVGKTGGDDTGEVDDLEIHRMTAGDETGGSTTPSKDTRGLLQRKAGPKTVAAESPSVVTKAPPRKTTTTGKTGSDDTGEVDDLEIHRRTIEDESNPPAVSAQTIGIAPALRLPPGSETISRPVNDLDRLPEIDAGAVPPDPNEGLTRPK